MWNTFSEQLISQFPTVISRVTHSFLVCHSNISMTVTLPSVYQLSQPSVEYSVLKELASENKFATVT